MAGRRLTFGRLLAGLLLLLAALLSPAAAFAHATLLASTPEDGAVEAKAPQSFRLTFNEPVTVTAARLSGGGRTVTLDRLTSEGASVMIEAPAGLADGPYALSYRVVSEDGHPIAGAVSFAIGAADAGPLPVLDPADPALNKAIWTARLALYLGLMFGAGGAFALAWLGAAAARPTVFASLALGLVAAPVAFGLQGADLVGAPLSGALDPVAWKQALASSYASTVAGAVVTLLVALASLVCRGAAAKALSALALCGVGLSLAASGHASAASPQSLMRPAVFVHAVAAAFWIGALAPVLVSLNGSGAADRTLVRFSAAAPFAIAALLAAGVVLAVRQVESLAALWTTGYGLVLSAKLALVAALFVLAAANRWLFTTPALAGSTRARHALRRSIAAEILIGVVVLGVVALWRFTPPPRALGVQSAQPAIAHLQTVAAQADITLTPGHAGKSDVSIVVMTGDFGPLDAKGLTLILSNPTAGVEALRREARKPGDGTWRVDGVQVPVPGRWTVRLEILVTDFDLERLEGRIDIRP